MKITIENNELVYMNLLEINQEVGVVDKTIPYVNGELLYDDKDNWIGIRLKNEYNLFNEYNFEDEYRDKVHIKVNESDAELFFNDNRMIVLKAMEQDFNIDVNGNRIYGIEMILRSNNSIVKRIIPDSMIE